jgi:hypothetical protein
VDPNLATISWLLFRGTSEQHLDGGLDPGRKIPWQAVLDALAIRDHFCSASVLIRLGSTSGKYAAVLSLHEAFIMAAYRLHRARGRLITTHEDFLGLVRNLHSIKDEDLEDWIRRRTVFTTQPGGGT